MEVVPGLTSLLTVTAQAQTIDPSLESVGAKRDCLFPGERPGGLFAKYEQENCIYECALRAAEGNASCFPWDMPGDADTKRRPCLGAEARRFKEAMAVQACEEECPTACTRDLYAVQVWSRA